MKKLLLSAILLFSITMVAQNQERHVYYNMTISAENKIQTVEAHTVIYVNYENKPVVKIYPPNGGEAVLYDSVSTVEQDVTVNGNSFWYGFYRKRGTNIEILIQLFKSREYGIRFISTDGTTTVQFY